MRLKKNIDPMFTDSLLSKLYRLHWPAFFLMLGLSLGGFFFIQSAVHMTDRSELIGAAQQQLMWIGAGCALYFTLALINYRTWMPYSGWIYGVMMLVLLITLIFATPVNGAKSWLRIAGLGIQPGEMTKVVYISLLAWMLNSNSDRVKTFKPILIAFGVLFLPMALILKQPDFGTAAVFAPITFTMLLAAGIRKRYLLLPVLAIVAVYAVSYVYVYKLDQNLPGLKPYQNNRIRTFFDPSRDPRGAGWTVRQSLIAVGSGGFSGKGYQQGDQHIYGFLPKNIAYNDFIFAVISEEFGFIGSSIIVISQALLLMMIVFIATRSADYLGVLIGAGVAGMFLTHFLVNVGMTIQVVPITGIPLPFVSYGGTFMIVCMACMGLLQSVWIHRKSK